MVTTLHITESTDQNYLLFLEKYSICRNHEVVVVKDIYFHNKSY
ncbi:hypothetical protein F948_01697 [Acinetobacter junii CIP 64.5]|nr:hypothetical protein F948_01697 [Acinetobacter junii CIP 64.5]